MSVLEVPGPAAVFLFPHQPLAELCAEAVCATNGRTVTVPAVMCVQEYKKVFGPLLVEEASAGLMSTFEDSHSNSKGVDVTITQ